MMKRPLTALFVITSVGFFLYMSSRIIHPPPLARNNQLLTLTRLGSPWKISPVSQKRPTIPREGPEIRQIVFAKVHKAASSTMQNIFMRFALARNLSLVLPKQKTSVSEHLSVIDRDKIVPHPQARQIYDVLCSHVLYDEEQISRYFPKAAVRIAIVREPLKQALSALKYYYRVWDPTGALRRGYKKYKTDPINSFLQHPEDFYIESRGPSNSYINNRMSVDLGFQLNSFEESKRNNTKIKEFLKKVQRQFDVVLVSDYFDESLVLMRRILRWAMKDIVYLKVNVGEEQTRPEWHKKPLLNSTVVQKFREWDEIDFQLYDQFSNIFLETIVREPLFWEELKAFRTIQTDVRYFCLEDKTSKILKIAQTVWTNSFSISRLECELMCTDEIKLTNLMRAIQTKRYEDYMKRKNNPTLLRERKKRSEVL
ncbi:hypothetical protein RRG08_017614 [Elysia crispata]|uniref:Uncharacterized protein n=1 Tax=Elysia crispata TaxID=231223 RepID=A0AAE1BAH6_9GAST|nr:hypothetical protein RRG08_017614 [Elysia crispata]